MKSNKNYFTTLLMVLCGLALAAPAFPQSQNHHASPAAHLSDPLVEKYNVIDPTRKRLPQKDRFENILNYEPLESEKVPFEKLDKLISKVRAEADQNNHRFALFDLTDACYLRNALFKKELRNAGVNLDKSSASIIVKYVDPNARWSFHSVSVVYTDKGPMVFDPDVKDEDQIFAGNLITPLATWLDVDWSHMQPIYMLAPPGYVNIDDFLNSKTVFKNTDPSLSFWGNFEGKTPRDAIFQNVIHPAKLNDEVIKRHLNSSQRTIRQSKINFEKLKKVNRP